MMEAVQKEHEKVWTSSRKAKTIEQTDNIIEALQKARDAISSNSASAQITLVKLQNPVKTAFDGITSNLKEIHGGHNKYTRALDKLFKDRPISNNDVDPFSSSGPLLNRAVYLHLLREGLFGVADMMSTEAITGATAARAMASMKGLEMPTDNPLGLDNATSASMQAQFTSMYFILQEMRERRNLAPAIEWARLNSTALEARGSNLEFELCRLQYMDLFLANSQNGETSLQSQMQALTYAQKELQSFRGRYLVEIQQLIGAMAFGSNLDTSPYKNSLNNTTSWDEVCQSFTREFCSLLELSADSPLYIAATAGAIALPQLMKLQTIQKEKRAEWTSANEMPVETPLPPAFHFHSIFVCPVSKEQSTDQNPPMMLPCCHVICQESLQRLNKGIKFKCPYCPIESHPKDARRVFL